MKEYKVIKEFGCAKVNDIFSYREDVAAYWMSAEEENPAAMQAIMKLGAIRCLIEDLKKKYEARNKKVQSKYDAGKMMTCVKVEHDTVNYNLMKLLNQFEKIVNE